MKKRGISAGDCGVEVLRSFFVSVLRFRQSIRCGR
jgi:hypothetical protein